MTQRNKISSVGKRLKEAMSVRCKRQADLANETGIAKGTISNYMHARYEPKAPAIAKLAKALDCSEFWLMGFDVPMDRMAYVDADDAELLRYIHINPKQELPPELEAINTLLALSGRQIIKSDDKYFLDECGLLTEEEVNELLNTIVASVEGAVDILTAKHTKELRDFLSWKSTKCN